MGTCRSWLLLAGLFALVLGNAAYAFDPDTDASLAGWWKLDDGAGTTAVDSSSGQHNGTLNGGPAWVTGHNGLGLQFDGTDDYVDTGWNTNLPTWTLSCWVTSPAAPNGTGQPSGPVHRENNYQINWNHSNGGTWPGSVAANIGGAWTACSLGPLEGNTWYFLCGTYDGTSLKAYTNGVLANTVNVPGTPNSETNTFKFGRHAANAAQLWAGTLDDVRVYNRALTADEVKLVMNAMGQGPATAASPADKATDVVREVVLSWRPGPFAGTHDVYLGTNFDDVNTASVDSPLCVGKGQDANSYDPPGRLDFGVTYYWRVDEVNATADHYVYKGKVLSFTTEPVGYRISKITATASASNKGSSVQSTVDESGLVGDLHDTSSTAMWSSGKKPALPVTLTYDFDKTYKLYQMLVWNSNGDFESSLNFGLQDVTVEYSADGTSFTKLGDFVFAQGDSAPDYLYNTVVDFGGVAAKAVKLIANSNYGGGQYGLAEVRFLYLPVWAREPKPDSNTAGIDPTGLTLKWRAGREAASHNVLIGTDPNALAAAGSSPTASYTPATLNLGAKYYWRVDEVNTTTTPTTWAGDVWFFTTPDFLAVDDFESYNDKEGTAIFNVWSDGFGTSTNGATVGYNNPVNGTYNDTVTFHGGKQAMPFLYNNTGTYAFSEVSRSYPTPQDWTRAGIKTLTLWFYGAKDNAAGQLYVTINETKIAYAGSSANLQLARWNPWNVDLTGVAAAKSVNKVIVGISGSGKGTLLIDDMRLYKTATPVLPPVDPGLNGLVSYFNMEGGKVADSISGITAANVNATTFVDSATAAFGKALQCTGGTTADTTQFVDLGATYWDKVVSKLSSCTMSSWVYYTDTGNTWQRILDFGSGTNNYVFLSTGSGTKGYPRFAVKNSVTNVGSTALGAQETGATSLQRLSVGWHHVAGVVDATGGAQGNPVITLYVDGVRVGGPNAARLPKDAVLTTTWQMWLGKSQWNDPYLNGAIDELRVFNRALTSGEVAYLAGDR